MTPESLDEYLAAFGEKVCMKAESGGKMVAVSQLREYVRRAIAVAESRRHYPNWPSASLENHAANEIERLRAECARLRQAVADLSPEGERSRPGRSGDRQGLAPGRPEIAAVENHAVR